MKVILTQAVEHVGHRGEAVVVREGYARNFLLPRNLAVLATPENVAQWSTWRKSQESKQQQTREGIEELCRRLESQAIEITAKVGEQNKLFGSITAADIAEAVQKKSAIELDRKKIKLDQPIHTTGEFRVPVKLHPEVEANLLVRVVSE